MSIRKGKGYPYGIKVKGRKSLNSGNAIITMPDPEKVYLSMSQHIGAPATPVVSVGDKVKKGQLIGKESGFVSANVYSSIAGTVVAVSEMTNGLGQKATYVVIENDHSNEQMLFSPLEDNSAQALVERVRLAGIVGLGGAGFPTAVKLSPKNPLDTLIINGAECEPYLTCDHRLMIERTEDIYKGIKLVAKILNVKNVIVGIEANKPDAIEAFAKYEDLDVVILKKQYPMGSEKHLIYCTTGRKVPTGKMPFDVGCSVQNVKTMIACYEAIELNIPLTQTVIAVSGVGINQPKNLKVALGTSFKDIAEYCGGLKDNVQKIIAGGPMMGKALMSLDHYARKTDSGFLSLIDGETDSLSPTNCINCGTCARNCPMRLMPMYIESYALSGNFAEAERYGAMNCLECGSCAYNCPAKRSLVQSISYAKSKIKEMKANGK